MQRFIFFTKTRWNEPPRLRHQLAKLLADEGCAVLFGERPGVFGRSVRATHLPPGISTFTHRELVHHRVRVGPLLRTLNRWWTEPSIRRAARAMAITSEDVVVNFNYEYCFLRDIFPRNPIITVINDDFVSRALPLCRESLHHAQRLTCRSSDAVITPSVVLQDQLRPYCDPQLFLPWADVPYRSPDRVSGRNTLLYWGFIDWRIDFGFLESLAVDLRRAAPDVELLVVGPMNRRQGRQPLFTAHPNVRWHPASKLDELPLNRMFASIIPFRSGVEGCDAIVMPNKAFQLAARGLPLLVTGMPRFAREPFIFRLDEGDAIGGVLRARALFEDLQPALRSFIHGNSLDSRRAQFEEIVKSAREARRHGRS